MLKTAQGAASRKNPSSSAEKSWFLKFMRSPKRVERIEDKLHLTLEVNRFDEKNRDRVVGTGNQEVDVCDLVFRSVGYKGRRIFTELPFDEATGVIPNDGGKIEKGEFCCGENSSACISTELNSISQYEGIYCCGWAGQGPRGVILSTMQNSFDVAKRIAQDIDGNSEPREKPGLSSFKDKITNKRLTSYKDFAKIAEFEAANHRKVTSIEEMFAIINGKL